ncbi:MAG TPA: PH domain-containing protein [Armatimonadetes bacterium]|nr:PH domain-containing protein [Armatimonadota bacterium]
MGGDKKIYLRPASRVLLLSSRLYIGLFLLVLTWHPWVQTQLLQLRLSRFAGVNWNHDYLFWIRLLAVVAILLSIVLVLFYRWRWRYMIGPRGVETMRGIIGRDERRVEYLNIRYVRVYQTFMQRLLGIGDVMTGTAATDDPEVIFYDVSSPMRIKSMVQDRQRQADEGRADRGAGSG